MLETLIPLLTAHLLGDFVFQSRRMADRKERIGVLTGHAAMLAGLSVLLLGRVHFPIFAGVFLSHWLIDFLKVKFGNAGVRAFLIDQLAHGVVILALAIWFPLASFAAAWPGFIPVDLHPFFLDAQCLLGGLALAAPAGGVLIQKLTESLRQEVNTRPEDGSNTPPEGLTHGGRYIGWLERLLTLLFVLIGQPSGIGFVIAAKSILRFGEIRDASQRRMAEYIIIGTFLSFGWAIAVSALVKAGLAYDFTSSR